MARERSSRVPLADSVYQTLFDQFLDGTRAAGEPLNIAVLSDELEVSQTPIREALARLEHTGLVRREPLKGYRVAPLLTEAELIQLMDARVLLEPALTTEAGKRVTPDFLQELLDTIVALNKAVTVNCTFVSEILVRRRALPRADRAAVRQYIPRYRLCGPGWSPSAVPALCRTGRVGRAVCRCRTQGNLRRPRRW